MKHIAIKFLLITNILLCNNINSTYTSPYEIIVHNCEPGTIATTAILTLAFPPAAPIILGVQIAIGSILAGTSCYLAYKKHKKNKTFAQITEEVKNSSCNNNGNPKKPDDKNDDEHPHGIYEDAPYHHQNSKGPKSPCPKDGQQCLDYSLWVKDGLRIAIENDTFVILRESSTRKFHGYAVRWKLVDADIRLVLRRNGYVTKSGNIIKQITEKALP